MKRCVWVPNTEKVSRKGDSCMGLILDYYEIGNIKLVFIVN